MVAAAKIEPEDLTVVQDVPTRWNSTFSMLDRAKRLQLPIDMFIKGEQTLKDCALTTEEWTFLDNILSILRPLDDVTNLLSASKYPKVSMVIPAYSGCLEQIQAVAD